MLIFALGFITGGFVFSAFKDIEPIKSVHGYFKSDIKNAMEEGFKRGERQLQKGVRGGKQKLSDELKKVKDKYLDED